MPSDSTAYLWVAVFEAYSKNERAQWLLFPPATKLVPASVGGDGAQRYLKRRFSPGRRSKWKMAERPTDDLGKKLLKELEQYASLNWTIRRPLTCPLEQDDYLRVWDTSDGFVTPYKAIRHIEQQAERVWGMRLV